MQKTEGGSHDTVKLGLVVITAAGLAIFLLWLLFSGVSAQKVRSESRLKNVRSPLAPPAYAEEIWTSMLRRLRLCLRRASKGRP